jgi:hypothetical protein
MMCRKNEKESEMYKLFYRNRFSALVCCLIVVAAMFMLSACTGNSGASGNTEEGGAVKLTGKGAPLTEEEITAMFADPNAYIDRKVEKLPGQVSNVWSAGGHYEYLCRADAEYKNVFGISSDKDLGLLEDDFVYLTGIVLGDSSDPDNPSARPVARLQASSVEKTEINLFNPELKTIESLQTIEHNGVTVSLEKIVAAQNNTRIYLKIANDTPDRIVMALFNCYIRQGSTQLDVDDGGYSEMTIQREINAGIETEGCLVFEKIPDPSAPFMISIAVWSDDYSVEIKPFIFGVPEGEGIPEELVEKEPETLLVDQTQTQNGVRVTIEKVELTNDLTNIYLTVSNDSPDKISIDDYSSYIKQNRTQFDHYTNIRATTIKTEINSGIESEGALPFEAMNNLSDPFVLHLEIRNHNYDFPLDPFEFTIPVSVSEAGIYQKVPPQI